MFHRLGKLLTTFYLHDEAQVIARHLETRGGREEDAAKVVLGISFEELGVGVAKAWNFPEEILDSMRPIDGPVRRRPTQHAEKLRLIASLANEFADLVRGGDQAQRKEQFASLVDRYGGAIGISDRSLLAALQASTRSMVRDADTLGQGIGRSDFLRTARAWSGSTEPESAQEAATADALAAGAAGASADSRAAARAPWIEGPSPIAVGPGSSCGDLQEIADTRKLATDAQLERTVAGTLPAASPAQPGQRHAALAAGVQDITNALVGELSLNDILRIILETMYRAIGFERVLLFVLDPRMQALRCRFGFGSNSDKIVQSGVAAPLNGPRDLFYAAVVMGADLCIDDLDSEKVRQHVPQWYRSAIGARGIVRCPSSTRSARSD